MYKMTGQKKMLKC